MFNSIEKKPRIINQDEPIDTGEDSVKNERAADLTKEQMDGTTYFDENESRFDQSSIDEATGNEYNNSQDMDEISPENQLVSEHDFGDVIGEDSAEKWLRENDPEYQKRKGSWGK